MRLMKTTLYTTWMFLGTLLFAGTTSLAQAIPDAETDHDPQPIIAETISKLIHRLEENRDQIKQDDSIAYRISDELIAPYIDFPRITRLVIGKYWRNATDAQRQRLIKEIQTLLIRSYVTPVMPTISLPTKTVSATSLHAINRVTARRRYVQPLR